MAVLRPSLIGAKTLGRTLGIWPFLFVGCWSLTLKLQEPTFFARRNVPFFWSSEEVMLMLSLGSLPLAWRLSVGMESAMWTLHTTRSHVTHTITTFLSVSFYGLALLTVATVVAGLADSISLYRISVWEEALEMCAWAGGFLLVTASLAPALAVTPWSTPTLVSVWLVILALALHLFGPVEISEPSLASGSFFGIVSTLLATLGGLAVSLAHTYHRLRH